MYWSLAQQLTHHTCNGCNMNPGDLIGTGTISGPTEDSYGSMLELCWAGQKDVDIGNGEIRKFLKDQDVCVLKGWAQKDGIRVGFGECRSKVLPAVKYGETVGSYDIREQQQQGMKQSAGA
jgi:fumarylacetoacetase